MVKLSGSKIQNCGRRLSWVYIKMAISLQPIGDMFSSHKYYENPIIKQQIFRLKKLSF